MKSFEAYSEEHVNFYEPGIVPPLLRKGIQLARKQHKKLTLVDVGCGDANLLHQLLGKNLLNVHEAIGVEPSPVRIKRAGKEIPIIQGTAEKIPFNKEHFDMVMATQIIEHIPDDSKLVTEAHRVLKKQGIFYVTSVVKKPYGIWIYRKDGTFVSDPTHYREYKSTKEFAQLIASGGFTILHAKKELFKHPLMDLFFRLLIKLRFLKARQVLHIYEKHPFLFFLRNALKFPMIGFYNVEVLAQK